MAFGGGQAELLADDAYKARDFFDLVGFGPVDLAYPSRQDLAKPSGQVAGGTRGFVHVRGRSWSNALIVASGKRCM